MSLLRTVTWVDGRVRLIDQTRLPQECIYIDCTDHREVAAAIKEMRVRGAPAIGVAAAYGVVLGAQSIKEKDPAIFRSRLQEVIATLKSTRPTAVNLFWALERMWRAAEKVQDTRQAYLALLEEAKAIEEEDEQACRRIGSFGAELIPQRANILTHCNAGALATAAYGTALGVIRAAHEQGKQIHVYVDETRPLLQGARLTAWELSQEGIPFTLITDNMAGHFLSRGVIDCVIVGADRIAANGDVANKIGTYTVAVLAHENGVPFYVAAPTSTVDLSLPSGKQIPIEERDPHEVTHLCGTLLAPPNTKAANPAFDITPSRYVTAIITDRGIAHPPFIESLRGLA